MSSLSRGVFQIWWNGSRSQGERTGHGGHHHVPDSSAHGGERLSPALWLPRALMADVHLKFWGHRALPRERRAPGINRASRRTGWQLHSPLGEEGFLSCPQGLAWCCTALRSPRHCESSWGMPWQPQPWRPCTLRSAGPRPVWRAAHKGTSESPPFSCKGHSCPAGLCLTHCVALSSLPILPASTGPGVSACHVHL